MEDNIAISIKNISKKYRLQQPINDANGNETQELWALKDISFDIKKGESVGIIGSNGSGKSTLLKILAGVTKPTTGSAEIKGKVASILDIGAGFHPELSGRDNVFLNGQIYGFTQSEIKHKYNEIVEFSGIEKFIDEPVKNYSNGMYLRLAFSIMAHFDFDVYLFDEVLSVGDAAFSLKTKEKYREMNEMGKTMVFVSHNLVELGTKGLYILLEKGRIRQASNEINVVSDYLENGIINNGSIIAASNVTLTDFSKFPSSNEIKILKVELYQEGEEEYRTDRPFVFKIEFEKFEESYTINPILKLADIRGYVILSSTPLISGLKSDNGKGTYTYKCIFPPLLFGHQTYKITIAFIKTTIGVSPNTDMSNAPSGNHKERIDSVIYKADDILVFKPHFKINHVETDLNALSQSVGLFPAFDWELDFQEKV